MSAARILSALAVVAAAALLALDATAAAAPSRTIAIANAGGYRAVVTAGKTSSGSAPTAALSVTTYVRSGSTWKRVGVRRLDGTFFWKTVTAPHGLCRLAVVRTPAPAHVLIRPLITPAIGCGATVSVGF